MTTHQVDILTEDADDVAFPLLAGQSLVSDDGQHILIDLGPKTLRPHQRDWLENCDAVIEYRVTRKES